MWDILSILLRYLRANHPLKVIWHTLWFFCILCMLSTTYIITFHFQPVFDLWQKSQNLNSFARELRVGVATDAKINQEISRLLETTSGNRSYLFRYHNGTPSANNVPFIFHTNTHEMIKPGTNRVLRFGQRLPSSLIHNENVEFLKNKCVSINNINRNVNSADYWIFETRNAVAVARCPIFAKNGDLIGFVGVDFSEPVSDKALKEAEDLVRKSSIFLGAIYDNA